MPLNTGLIVKELTLIGSKIVNDAKANASWSTTIPGAIRLGTVMPGAAGFVIEIKVDLNEKTGEPQAAAFELGSGIHATRGPKGKYKISPRNKFALAIPFDRWRNFKPPIIGGPKMIGEGDQGLLLRFVEHPGVAPRPFIAPAITANIPEIKSRLLKAFGLTVKSISKRVEIIR